MNRLLINILFFGIVFSQDDGLPPNFVYLEPIEDFYSKEPISLEIIITDRNEISRVSMFYRFNDATDFIRTEMNVGSQPVIYNVEISLDEVVPGFIQYYFWAKDEYGNEATWPNGGEDLPMVLPIYSIKAEKIVEKPPVQLDKIDTEYIAPDSLEDNLPYYLEIGMLAPEYEVKYEEGVPIIVLSVFDSENIVNQESVKLLIDEKEVISFNSEDMITFIPESFEPGYHIIRYESKNLSDEILIKDFLFFMNEKITDESEIDKITWKEKIKLKGNFGWNTDYDPDPQNPIDVHKINTSAKFEIGDYKFDFSGLTSTNIFDSDAREQAKRRQPSTRLKMNMKSKYIDINYGDNSPEFSEFSLKGTRVRGIYTKIKWKEWETALVSGETKHWINSKINEKSIDIWDLNKIYKIGEQVYDNSITWIAQIENVGSEPCIFSNDTCAVNIHWLELEESTYSEIPNDACLAIEPGMYGLNPDTNIVELSEYGGSYWVWNGLSCEENFLYSSINMITGEDGLENGDLYKTFDECREECLVPVNFQKGAPIRYIQGLRTSNDFYEHIKLGISAIRSRDIKDKSLTPYTVLDEFNYEGNFVVSGDFMLHFNSDRTIFKGEYGISMTINQESSDTLLLKTIHDIDQNLYDYTNWDGVDYCLLDNECINLGDDTLIIPESNFFEGVSDSLLEEINSSRIELEDYEKIFGFSINDDINAFGDGRGVSGLTGVEVGEFRDGNISERIGLLLKKPAYKLIFKTPIPLSFTELNFQSELSQAPINYLSHGSSSIQTNVRNWKNKLAFKVLKNQLNLSFGYDSQIKSPWNPESEDAGEIKRAMTDTRSGSIGLSFRNYPGLNYSIRLQDREDLTVFIENGTLIDSTTSLKKLSTHTLAPTYKIKFGKININLNGNISIVNDLDILSDNAGCFEILNNTSQNEWGGIADTSFVINGDTLTCEGNNYYFSKNNNPLNDSGNQTSTYTGALSFSFPVPLSLNLGIGLSINSPIDIRQSKTAITVFSTKIGYKFLNNKLNATLGGNYVIGFKDKNGFWDKGEILEIDEGAPDEFDLGDVFIDKVELDNSKLSLKFGLQYKIPDQNISIGLNVDYSQSINNLVVIQEDSKIKAKIAIKYGF